MCQYQSVREALSLPLAAIRAFQLAAGILVGIEVEVSGNASASVGCKSGVMALRGVLCVA
jgi:hypothetical protein